MKIIAETTTEKNLIIHAIKSASLFIAKNEEDALSCEKLLIEKCKIMEISNKCSYCDCDKNTNGQLSSKKNKQPKETTFSIWANSEVELKTLAVILLHEWNHATATLNAVVINDRKNNRKIRYEGFTKIIIQNDEIKSIRGLGLNEFVNDFVTYMQFFNYYRPIFKSLKHATADYNICLNQKFWPTEADRRSGYLYAMSIPRLLAVACENKPNTSYEYLLNNGISPVVGKTIGRNGEIRYINDMINASKFSSRDLKCSINKLTNNPKSYDKLIKNCDYILEQINSNNFNKNNLNDESKTVLIETFNIIKKYHEKKAEYFLLTGFWNEDDFQKSHEKFNYVYNDVLKEFNLSNTKNKRMVK